MCKKKKTQGPSPPPIVPHKNFIRNLSAFLGFTLLAFDLPSSAPHDLQPSPVQAIMRSFGWDDMVHPLLVTRYLYLLENR